MYTKKRLTRSAALLALSATAVLVQGTAVAAVDPSGVPVNWNVSSFKTGAYLEDFDTRPPWATEALAPFEAIDSHVDVFNVPARTYAWFDPTTQALKLDTGDASITNTFVYAGGTKVSFATRPVFVDMRVKFVAMPDDVEPNIGDAKLAVYVNSAGTELKIRHSGPTTSVGRDSLTTKWHQLTIRMDAGFFDVLLDDAVVATNLVPIGASTDTDFNSISFAGTGYIDDLYVSHGNPAYAGTIGSVPTAAEQFSTEAFVRDWLGARMNDSLLTSGASFEGFDKTKIDTAYLLNTLGGNSTTALPVNPTFGIKSFDIVASGTLHIVLELLTGVNGNSVTINGKIQLQGKTAAGSWTNIGTPFAAKFVNGLMTPADFTGVSADYRFFRARIVAP